MAITSGVKKYLSILFMIWILLINESAGKEAISCNPQNIQIQCEQNSRIHIESETYTIRSKNSCSLDYFLMREGCFKQNSINPVGLRSCNGKVNCTYGIGLTANMTLNPHIDCGSLSLVYVKYSCVPDNQIFQVCDDVKISLKENLYLQSPLYPENSQVTSMQTCQCQLQAIDSTLTILDMLLDFDGETANDILQLQNSSDNRFPIKGLQPIQMANEKTTLTRKVNVTFIPRNTSLRQLFWLKMEGMNSLVYLFCGSFMENIPDNLDFHLPTTAGPSTSTTQSTSSIKSSTTPTEVSSTPLSTFPSTSTEKQISTTESSSTSTTTEKFSTTLSLLSNLSTLSSTIISTTPSEEVSSSSSTASSTSTTTEPTTTTIPIPSTFESTFSTTKMSTTTLPRSEVTTESSTKAIMSSKTDYTNAFETTDPVSSSAESHVTTPTNMPSTSTVTYSSTSEFTREFISTTDSTSTMAPTTSPSTSTAPSTSRLITPSTSTSKQTLASTTSTTTTTKQTTSPTTSKQTTTSLTTPKQTTTSPTTSKQTTTSLTTPKQTTTSPTTSKQTTTSTTSLTSTAATTSPTSKLTVTTPESTSIPTLTTTIPTSSNPTTTYSTTSKPTTVSTTTKATTTLESTIKFSTSSTKPSISVSQSTSSSSSSSTSTEAGTTGVMAVKTTDSGISGAVVAVIVIVIIGLIVGVVFVFIFLLRRRAKATLNKQSIFKKPEVNNVDIVVQNGKISHGSNPTELQNITINLDSTEDSVNNNNKTQPIEPDDKPSDAQINDEEESVGKEDCNSLSNSDITSISGKTDYKPGSTCDSSIGDEIDEVTNKKKKKSVKFKEVEPSDIQVHPPPPLSPTRLPYDSYENPDKHLRADDSRNRHKPSPGKLMHSRNNPNVIFKADSRTKHRNPSGLSGLVHNKYPQSIKSDPSNRYRTPPGPSNPIGGIKPVHYIHAPVPPNTNNTQLPKKPRHFVL